MQLQITFEPNSQPPLSSREWEILSLLAEDLSNAQIARRLIISQNTVKVHLRTTCSRSSRCRPGWGQCCWPYARGG